MKVSGYLGLDLGGTGAKAGVYDGSGRMLGFGRESCTPTTDSEGHVEIPVQQIYEAARLSARRAVEESRAVIRAMAVASQGETFTSLDSDDRPLHPAILWYDSRASAQADRLRQAARSPTLLIEAISSAPKIMWLREKDPDMASRARRFLLLPDYISYRLTGEAVTDPSTANSTGLYADDAPDYCAEALQAAGIGRDQLARIATPGSAIGRVLPEMAEDWGLDPGTLLVVGTNDQYAGALGAGNCQPGIVSETTGTCLSAVTLTEKLPEPMPAGLYGGRFPIPRYQFGMAYSKTAGLVIEWFNRTICPGLDLDELGSMAATVPIGSNGLVVVPHFDGMVSPRPNPGARGMITGLTLSSGVADIYRAILESLSFSLRENLEFLRESGFDFVVIRSIGGGAKSDLWLQMKADVTGLTVERPKSTEAATLGAAMLAAVGAGDYPLIEECSESFYSRDRVFEPDAEHSKLYEKPYQAYRDLCNRVWFS